MAPGGNCMGITMPPGPTMAMPGAIMATPMWVGDVGSCGDGLAAGSGAGSGSLACRPSSMGNRAGQATKRSKRHRNISKPSAQAHLHATRRQRGARLAEVFVSMRKGAAGSLVAVPRLHVLDAQPRLVEGLVAAAGAAAGECDRAAAARLLAAGVGLPPGIYPLLRRVLQLLLGLQLRHNLRRHVPQLVLTVCIGALVAVGARPGTPPAA
jgi:hypothetical protein